MARKVIHARRKRVISSSGKEEYSNLEGKTWQKPGVGKMSGVPARFMERNGKAIRYSLHGTSGKRVLYQRCKGADWHRRLLAMICLQEAKYDLGYHNAVVWIGDKQFVPGFDDFKDVGWTPEQIKATTGLEHSRRGKRKETEEMAAKKKASKKKMKDAKKKAKKSGFGGRISEPLSKSDAKARSQTNGRNFCTYLLATTRKINDKKLRRAVLEFDPGSVTAKKDNKYRALKEQVLAGKVAWVGNVNVHAEWTGSEKKEKKGSAKKVVKKKKKKKKGATKAAKKLGGKKVIKKLKR